MTYEDTSYEEDTWEHTRMADLQTPWAMKFKAMEAKRRRDANRRAWAILVVVVGAWAALIFYVVWVSMPLLVKFMR